MFGGFENKEAHIDLLQNNKTEGSRVQADAEKNASGHAAAVTWNNIGPDQPDESTT